MNINFKLSLEFLESDFFRTIIKYQVKENMTVSVVKRTLNFS